MFPSKVYIQECIENADRLREEWEPKFGDWAIEIDGDNICLVLAEYNEVGEIYIIRESTAHYRYGWVKKSTVIPLFQPRQLREMLEERGVRYWELRATNYRRKNRKGWNFWARVERPPDQWERLMFQETWQGPDPETALLGAWLEVVKDGGKNLSTS